MPFDKRIVITGMGVVSNVGTNVASFWEGLIRGRSGIDRIRLWDPAGCPVQIAGEVKESDLAALIPETLPPCPLSHCPHRAVLMAVAAASEAVLQSGLRPENWDPRRVGLSMGNGIGTMNFEENALASPSAFVGEELVMSRFMKAAIEIFDPRHELEWEADVSVDALADGWNIQGPCSISLTACAASSQAIGEAAYWIATGRTDIVLAGGTHSILDVFGVTGFAHLTACSTRNEDPPRASRPFDRDRDGFVMAEGAGILVLESEDHARKRGAEILAEISGYGLSTDAYRVTDPDSEELTCAKAIEQALESARIVPEELDVINAHGTSTLANDRTETLAIKKVFRDKAYEIPVHSIKSMIGHAIAAAGVLEAIAAVQTIKTGIVPPTINQENPDPECDLDYVPNVAREMKVDHVLSSSFGFGGQNVGLVFRRWN